MFNQLLNSRNFQLLFGGCLGILLYFAYHFATLMLESHSYLVLQPDGQAFRRVVWQYAYHKDLIAFIYAMSAFFVLALLGLFFFIELKKPSPLSIVKEEEPEQGQNKNEKNSGVFYGREVIDAEMIANFVETYPESAIKFVFHRNVDETPLDSSVRALHNSWVKRGMTEEQVRNEILGIMDWQDFPKQNLYEITLEIKDKIDSQKGKADF